MEKRRLGTTDIEVSVIGLGSWPMGGDWWGGTDDDESIRTIHRALDLGVNLIDTAEGYANGHSEEVVGRGLKGRRHEAIIATKVAPNHLTPEGLREAFAGSCKRMGTDYLDIYLIHWPNIDVPIEPAMTELEKMRSEGLIRAIGVSNFNPDEMEEARKYGKIDLLQPPYNMFWRFIEKGELPYCRQNNIGIMTYSSLAQGLLTGAITRETIFREGDSRPTTVLFQPENLRKCLDAVDKLTPIAQKYGKTVAQLAINWVISRPGVTTSLLGARTVREIEENAQGVVWQLSTADFALVDGYTREVFESLPVVPDMFQNWQRWDLQRRRYEKEGLMPQA